MSASCVLKELVHVFAVRILSSGCTRVTLGCGSSNSFASVMFSKHLTCIRSFKHGTPLYFMLLKINLGGKKTSSQKLTHLYASNSSLHDVAPEIQQKKKRYKEKATLLLTVRLKWRSIDT